MKTIEEVKDYLLDELVEAQSKACKYFNLLNKNLGEEDEDFYRGLSEWYSGQENALRKLLRELTK